MKLVFMGTPAYAVVSLRRLVEHTSHEILAVVTRPDARSGRGRKLQPSAVKSLALERGLEVLEPPTARNPEFAARLRELGPDLGVVVAYGRFLPAEVLEIPPLGCINAHGSLLPAFRGAAPIERALLAGVERTGVSIMRINERMDAGDVMLTRSVEVTNTTTGGELRGWLAEISADLLEQAVETLARGEARFVPQDESCATYAPPIEKEDLRIDWTHDAELVHRRIRTFFPTPGAFTFLKGKRVKILRADLLAQPAPAAARCGDVLRADPRGIVVRCGSESLCVHELQPEGARSMSAGEYLRGHASEIAGGFDA